MLGYHAVAEPLVKDAIAAELAPHADSHLAIALARGVSVSPFHQRPTDALTLVGGVDRNPSNVQVARLSLEPEPAHNAAVDGGKRSPVGGQVVADVGLGLLKCPAGRIQPAVTRESALREAVQVSRTFRTAGGDLQTGYTAFTAATSLVSESFASPKSMIVFGS